VIVAGLRGGFRKGGVMKKRMHKEKVFRINDGQVGKTMKGTEVHCDQSWARGPRA